jgi:hypothetical protein
MEAVIQLDTVELDEDRSSWIETEKKDTEFGRPSKKPHKVTEKKGYRVRSANQEALQRNGQKGYYRV